MPSSFDDHTQRVQKQFTRQAQAYASTEQARDLKSMAGLVRLTKADDSCQTLDVACGPGRLTMAFADQAGKATGLDATESLLDIARGEAAALALSNIEFHYGSALEMPFADASFDVVSCRAAFHHFGQPSEVLAEMKRVCKADGQLLIADILGNSDPAKATAHDEFERLCDVSHARCLPAEEFASMFATHGLREIRTLNRSADYELGGWIAHGGPDAAQEAKIRELFALNLADDTTGLQIRDEGGVLRFSHQTVVYLLGR